MGFIENQISEAGQTQVVTRHAVRDHIARRIAGGDYQSGMKLVQRNLANEMGVSRGVVREALFELSGMGLVETMDHRGAIVNDFNDERLVECYELREVLEGLAARRCCERITIKQLRDLRAMADEILRLYRDGKDEEGGRLDREFHLQLVQIAGNRLVERLTSTYAVLGKVITNPNRDPELVHSQHQMILNDIQAGDPEQAERSAREHIRGSVAGIRKQASKPPGVKWL